MKKRLLLIPFLSIKVFASGYYTPDNLATILWINNEQSLVRLALKHDTKLNPDSCGTDSAVVLRIEDDYDQAQYSSLLAAMMAGKKVRLYVSGCEAGWGTSYPRVTASYIYN